MADITLYSRVNNLYYSSEEWSILNPVLLKGEVGFDTTNRNFKVGDGTSHWNTLPFFPIISVTIPQANNTTLGGIKVGFTESGKNYPVELNSSGQAFVNVPWTDTKYTPGTGLSFSGTTINHASIITAGSAGPNANAKPSHGGSFTVPQITYNSTGHITGVTNRSVTLPAGMTLSTTSSNRYLLGSTATSGGISTSYISTGVYADSSNYVHTNGVYIGSAYISRNSTTGALEFHT